MNQEIGILTDSTSDVPPEAAARYGIEVVPAIIVLSGQSLRDGIDISRAELYRRMTAHNIIPTTSSPSAGAFETAYRHMLKAGYRRILSIHPAEKLSSIYSTARLAASGFEGRVEVVESGQVSLGSGFQVFAAAEQAAAGAPMEKILAGVRSVRNRVHLAAMIDSLTHLAHSGRVSMALAGIGNFLNIKLLIDVVEGTVNRIGQVRTHSRGLQALVDQVRTWGPLERVAVVHANARSTAESLIPLLSEKVNGLGKLFQTAPLLVEVTPTIGIHAGPGAVGVIAVSASPLR